MIPTRPPDSRPPDTVKCYTTEHQHSRVIMAAFAEGCKGQIVPPFKLLPGMAAAFGILRGTAEIVRQCEWVRRDYFYIDHGYVTPGHYAGWYRVTKNGRQAVLPDQSEYVYPDDRLLKLKKPLRPWRRAGRHVLVIPLTGPVGEYYNIDSARWIETVTTEISQHTNRPIVVKVKGEGDIGDSLNDCWCVVSHSSNVAVDALFSGVPAVVLGESACETVSWELADIENPWWPEREFWARALAYHQFNLDEMRDGTAWRQLNK